MSKFYGKSVIACMAMLFCLGGEVKAQNKLCLQEIETQLEGDYTYFNYNEKGLLDSTYIYTSYYDEEIYQLYKYDDKGNMTTAEGFCILPNEDLDYHVFSKTYEIDYEYDEKGRVISRKNYNLDTWGGTGDFLLGGVYVYEYDEKGLLKQRRLYWDDAKTDLFETTNFKYDENDRLIEESYLQHSFGTATEEMVVAYYYDEKGRLVRLRTDAMNYNTGVIEENDNLAYTYDDNDNLISRLSYPTDPNFPNEEHILTYYKDTLAADVCMPLTSEDDMDFYTRSTNIVKQDSIYRRDVEGVTFDLFDIQDWKYNELNTAAGIESVIDNGGKILSVSRDNEGNIMLNGVSDRENIRVYDANGRIIRNGAYNGKVNMSGLPNGMYIVATRQGCVKFSK